MKNFILKLGRFLIDFFMIIQFLAIVVFSIGVGIGCIENVDDVFLGIISGVATFLILSAFFAVLYYFLYLLINMHDQLESIAKNTENLSRKY